MYTLDKAVSMKKGVCGVYAIFISSNPKVAYIGSSKCIRRRLMSHLNQLKKGKHKNWKLQRMWGIYRNEFRWSILEISSSEYKARATEQLILSTTDPDKLYNIDMTVYNYNHNKGK